MYDFVDESFRKEDLLENILSIQVSLNGFSFCIRRTRDQKLLIFHHSEMKISSSSLIARRLEDWLDENEFLKSGFNEIHVFVLGTVFTLIPKVMDNEQNRTDFLRLLFAEPVHESFCSPIEALNATLCSSLPEGLNEVLNRKMPGYKLHHIVEKMLQNNTENHDPDQLRLFFDEKDLYLALILRDKPVLCNSYRINHANDAVYFILTTLKQFRLSPQKLPAVIGGKSGFLKEVTNTLAVYFSSIGSLSSPEREDAVVNGFPC